MIKNIQIKTSKQAENLEVGLIQLNNETVALATTAIENVLLADRDNFIERMGIKPNTLTYDLEVNLINKVTMDDIIKALRNGDIVAKKRVLKELEGL